MPADSCEDFPRPFALGWAGLAVAFPSTACLHIRAGGKNSIEGFLMIPKEVSNKARECNGFKWLTLIGLRIVRIHLWFDLRGRPKHSAVFLFYQGRHWPYLGAPLQHIATNALVTHQSLDHIVQHLQHRSHRQTSLLGRFTCQKQGCRNPPAPHRFPARLLSQSPPSTPRMDPISTPTHFDLESCIPAPSTFFLPLH